MRKKHEIMSGKLSRQLARTWYSDCGMTLLMWPTASY